MKFKWSDLQGKIALVTGGSRVSGTRFSSIRERRGSGSNYGLGW
ncbi:MAG: hypothetical protein CM1200mP14_24490 [Gammaproteobacteria bacterium]|nr:MAG: hypothetical protein CM1200mP14_24490 [Gammaproteobacteria bacterium]